jgi:hypothetical protein
VRGAREDWVVPPGLEVFFQFSLKRWAKLVRPSGAGFRRVSARGVNYFAFPKSKEIGRRFVWMCAIWG